MLYQVVRGNRTGYANAQGKLIVDYKYPSGTGFENGYAVLTNDSGRRGAIDVTGKLIIPFNYIELRYRPDIRWWIGMYYPDSLRIFRLDGTPDLYHGLGSYISMYVPLARIFISTSANNPEQTVHILDLKGKEINAITGSGDVGVYTIPDYTAAGAGLHYSHHGLQLNRGEVYAVLDLNGHIIYDSVRTSGFAYGESALTGRNKAALIDSFLREIIPFSAGYASLRPIDGMRYFLARKKDGLSGIIDRRQNIIVPFVLEGELDRYTSELLEMRTGIPDRQYIVYNYSGELILISRKRVEIGYLHEIHNQPLLVQTSDTVYRLWKGGRIIGKPYKFISPYSNDGYAVFNRGDETGLLDSLGNELFTTQYDQLSLPVNGILAAGERLLCGKCKGYSCAQGVSTSTEFWVNQFFYLDLKGRRIGADVYDAVLPFYEGEAKVAKRCAEFYIDTGGMPVGSDQYRSLTVREGGVKVVADKQRNQYLMDLKGRIISPPVTSFSTGRGGAYSFVFFDHGRSNTFPIGTRYAPELQRGLIKFKAGALTGLMDTLGHIVIPAEYGTIFLYDHFILVYKTDGRTGLMNAQGKMLLPAEYFEIGGYNAKENFLWIRKEKNEQRSVFKL